MPLLGDVPIYVVDCETTGLDPATDRLVEIAALGVEWWPLQQRIVPTGSLFSTLCDPARPIPADVSAVHHLTMRDIDAAMAPRFEVALQKIDAFLPANALIVAHNAEFDRSFITSLADRPWLCTKRLAMHIFPNAPNHRNQTLRYWLDLKVDLGGMVPHRALADCMVTARILGALLEQYTAVHGDDVDELIAFAEAPVMMQRMPFGKHAGASFDAIPTDYLEWLIGERGPADLSRDLRATVLAQLEPASDDAPCARCDNPADDALHDHSYCSDPEHEPNTLCHPYQPAQPVMRYASGEVPMAGDAEIDRLTRAGELP